MSVVFGVPAASGGNPGSGGSVLELVESAVLDHGDVEAVRDDLARLTYRDLWAASDSLARRLLGSGVQAGEPVAIWAGRGVAAVVGVLGVMRAGAACLALDPDLPERRLSYHLNQAGPRVVVVDRLDVEVTGIGDDLERIEIGTGADIAPEPGAQLPAVGPRDSSYIVYTSGSTGNPKGIVQRHEGLSVLVRWQCRQSGTAPGEVTLQSAPLSFDVAYQEIFATLAAAGTLVMVDAKTRRDPMALWQKVAAERAVRLFMPFVGLEGIAWHARAEASAVTELREVIVAGEQLTVTPVVRDLFSKLSGVCLVNQYGPAETHVVSAFRLSGDPSEWPTLPPIGSPVDGAALFIVGDDGGSPPAGQAGELYVGGPSLAKGYHLRDDLTEVSFGYHQDGTRLYRTGDIVRQGISGDLEFLGRVDDQVKIRGSRVEPAEVEAVLTSCPGVRVAVVLPIGHSAADRTLVAYVQASDGVTSESVRVYAAEVLPEFAVPSRIEVSSQLPVGQNGKIDRLRLRVAAERDAGAR